MKKRNVISVLSRLRANHYNIGESLVRKRLVEDPGCECGETIEDTYHMLWECPRYNDLRSELIAKLKARGVHGRPQSHKT